MKIFILSDSYAPHTRRWVNWFSENNHEVYLISFNSKILPNYSPKIESINFIGPPPFINRYISKFIKIPYILTNLLILYLKHKPSIIHLHTSGGYAWAPFILNLPNRVITPWGTDILIDINRSKINYLFTKMALKNAMFVTTDAEFFKPILINLGVIDKKIYVHNFGTDVKKFKSKSNKKELGNKKEFTIISTRTPNPVHDVSCFIDAIPKIISNYEHVNFIVVGDGIELNYLKNRAIDLHVFDYINFTGMVEEEEMIELLEQADIYVSTSSMDAGLSASTAEAMAMNKPVISTDNSDNRLWVHEGMGGYLFENSNSTSLSNSLIKLINQPENIKNFGIYNRNLIESKYNTDIELALVSQLYISNQIPKR
jgi:glycosyltransferase involved in cell wall biosynthesis